MMSATIHSMMASVLFIGSLAAGIVPAPVRAQASDAQSDATASISRLEEGSYDAWKAGNVAAVSRLVSEKFVGWGASGRTDKQAAMPVLSGAACRIASYRLINKQVTHLTSAAALITHRTEADGTCNGKSILPAYTATVYVREGTQWRIGYRARSIIVDPMKAVKPARSDIWASGATRADKATQDLLARENFFVDAWKNHDAVGMDRFFGYEIQFIDIFGNHIGSRTQALKAWSGEGCTVKNFEFGGANATMLAPDFGILTYRAAYVGDCFGQALWPIWGAAFYVKRGGNWLWSSGINVLAGSAGE
jgi:hypothetical protein